jgi:LacI family transcriptional regulator
MKRITIKELAQLSNVSTKTVSKALNDQPGVNKELRKKIKKLAQKTNYIPNLFGRGLKGNSVKTVGVIVTSSYNPNFADVISGIGKIADEFGYSIILCNSDEDLKTENKQIELLIQKQVDGIILTPASDSFGAKRAGIEKLKKLEIPYILIYRNIKGEEKNCVRTDNVQGGYIATKYLIEKGHRNIIFLTPHLRPNKINSASYDRFLGYKKALGEINIKAPEDNVYHGKRISLESGYEVMSTLLKARRDFTAVFCFNDIIAFGAIKAIHEWGLKIPSDIGVIGFDNMLFSQVCLVPLTTVHQESYKIGYTAMEIILKKLSNDTDIDKQEMIFTPRIIERLSA